MLTVAINNPYLPSGGWQCCLEIVVNVTGTEYNISGFFDKAGLLTETDSYRRVCEPGKDTKWLIDCQIVDGTMNGVFPALYQVIGGNRILEMLREIGTDQLVIVADRDCEKFLPKEAESLEEWHRKVKEDCPELAGIDLDRKSHE